MYIHHTIHGFGYNPMNDGGRYSIQSPFVSNLPPTRPTLSPPFTFRMLQNTELAGAMGFDDDETKYEFVGNIGEVTKQIGNAVPVNLAAALVGAILRQTEKPEDVC